MERRCIFLPVCRCVQQSGSSLNSILFGFGGRLYHIVMIINSISSPSSFLRKWGAGLKFPNFLSWLGLSHNQPSSRKEPTQSHLIRTKDTLIAQELQGFKQLCARNQGGKPTQAYMFSMISNLVSRVFLSRHSEKDQEGESGHRGYRADPAAKPLCNFWFGPQPVSGLFFPSAKWRQFLLCTSQGCFGNQISNGCGYGVKIL